MQATVKYQVATYYGELKVNCTSYEEDEAIIGRAKRILTVKTGPIPFGYQSWKVISRD